MSEVIKEVPAIWTTGWTDILNTGTWRSSIPVYQKRLAPCHCACPVNGEIPTWVALASKQLYYEAWLALVSNNPIPAVTGRICHHPCEGACNRGEYDGAVSVNSLEQFIGDLALKEGWSLPKTETEKDQKIAVVGGGPAGLSCAYQLRRRGYKVTVFEARAELGGVLLYGIPRYRLSKEIVGKEIKRLLELGIDVKLNQRINADDLTRLKKEYSAVFLAFGAQRAKELPQFAGNNPRVHNALEFLERTIGGEVPQLGEQVVIIGGGSVALDAAGTLRRLGKQVKLLALEDRDSLPARSDELAEALEEGIEILDGVMVQEVKHAVEGVGLQCIKVTLDKTVPAGVIKPILQDGTEFMVNATDVILAIGQDPELAGWDAELSVEQSLIKVNNCLSTSRDGVFAGGDVTQSERYVSTAIGLGKKAALSIVDYLNGQPNFKSEDPQDTVSYQEINTFYFPGIPREDKGKVLPEQRLQNFNEVKIGFTPQQLQIQSERCFSCGSCVECDNCFYFCPDMAVAKDASLPEKYKIIDQYCKGCGLCVEECPRGAVVLKEEVK